MMPLVIARRDVKVRVKEHEDCVPDFEMFMIGVFVFLI
jgi:hypothetical protein